MGSPVFAGTDIAGQAWNTLNLSSSSEDCLYVNVYAPVDATAHSQLPVLLYLHAGEFRYGTSNDAENNWPYNFGGRVVLVTANVRLNIFGFAAHDVLRQRCPEGSTGNYGMQDQRQVMRWVQRSIHAFGGDASRVTIAGESSGGTSVGYHLTNPRSAGLFARAILQSPGLTQSKPWEHALTNTELIISALTAARSVGCGWANQSSQWIGLSGVIAAPAQGQQLGTAPTLKEAQEQCDADAQCYLVFADLRGNASFSYIGGMRAGAIAHNQTGFYNLSAVLGLAVNTEVYIRLADRAQLVSCLVNADPQDLIALSNRVIFDDTFVTDGMAPAVDGIELPANLGQLVRDPRRLNDADVLGGSNLDEGTEFMGLTPRLPCNATAAQFAAWAAVQFGPDLGAHVPPLYTTVEQPAPLCRDYSASTSTSVYWQAAMRSAGDASFLCRTRELLRAARARNHSAFWYYFRVTPTYSENMESLEYCGAFHGAEVPFVFGYPNEIRSAPEQRVSAAMGCYWSNFIEWGNPNDLDHPVQCAKRLGLPEWPMVGNEGDAMSLSIDASNATVFAVMPQLRKDKCDLYAQYPDSGI